MHTIPAARRGQARPEGQVPTESVFIWIVAVVGTLIFMIIFLADGNPRARTSAVQDCSVIVEKDDRLACYDGLAHQPAPQPAKGANAPELFHSR